MFRCIEMIPYRFTSRIYHICKFRKFLYIWNYCFQISSFDHTCLHETWKQIPSFRTLRYRRFLPRSKVQRGLIVSNSITSCCGVWKYRMWKILFHLHAYNWNGEICKADTFIFHSNRKGVINIKFRQPSIAIITANARCFRIELNLTFIFPSRDMKSENEFVNTLNKLPGETNIARITFANSNDMSAIYINVPHFFMPFMALYPRPILLLLFFHVAP